MTHLHPGVTRVEVDDNTGFDLEWAPQPAATSAPSASELQLLDTTIDPDGLRFLESLTGAPRRNRLRSLAAQGGASDARTAKRDVRL